MSESQGCELLEAARDVRKSESPWTDGARAAFLAFACVEAVALANYVYIGRRHWFWGDEWDFLASRSLTVHGLFAPHGGHLVALPVAYYRVLFDIFGLRTYLPYQVMAIMLHLIAAALLRAIMRRGGVHPWIATAAATLFVLFGAGRQNILVAFQITFSGALVLGLVQLLLADHRGAIDRRDVLGLAAGMGALACSGVGAVMVGTVAIAALIQRGWRIAAFHTLPVVAIYGAWLSHYRVSVEIERDQSLVERYVRRLLASTFQELGQLRLVGIALACMLAAGIVVAWLAGDPTQRRRRAAIPAALLAGAVIFLVMIGFSRAMLGLDPVSLSRYVHITGALLLVPMATAADALVRHWRVLMPVVLALFLAGIPGNIAIAGDRPAKPAVFDGFRQMMLSLPRMEIATRVPSSLRPEPHWAPEVTLGWLRSTAASGRLPMARPLEQRERATNVLRLSLQQLDSSDGRTCVPLSGPVVRHLRRGESMLIQGQVQVQLLSHGNRTSSDLVRFGSSFRAGRHDHTIVAVIQALALRIIPASRGAAAC